MQGDWPLMRRLAGIWIVLCTLLLGACNHLFYHPMQGVYATPDKAGIAYEEKIALTPDGERLALWHLKPKGKPKNAVVLHFHGNAENMTTHFLFVAWLAEQGFDVVTFDYRGYGASTGEANRAGTVEDGKAMLRWVRSEPSLKGKPLFVFAQSLGGAVAIPAVAQTAPCPVKAVIAECTFDSYRTMARSMLGSIWLTWPLQYPLSFLVTDELSPIDSVGELCAPLLIVHTKNDKTIPIARGRALYDAAKAEQKEFWEVEKGGHTAAFVEGNEAQRQRLVEYLCRYLSSC